MTKWGRNTCSQPEQEGQLNSEEGSENAPLIDQEPLPELCPYTESFRDPCQVLAIRLVS